VPAHILIVEDDKELSRMLQLDLKAQGYEVSAARDGIDGLRLFHSVHPDLVVLDIALPLMDGRAICQRIREISDVPIMMMTAHAVSEEEMVQGLNLGADEFMIKPLRPAEFQARVRALLRRSRAYDASVSSPMRYQDDYLSVDLLQRRVTVDRQDVRLTPTEFKLLALFIQNPGTVISFQQLLEQVWGFEYTRENHYPRIYVSHLRRKLEPDVRNPTYIQSEYGVGYRFIPQTSGEAQA
jgi:DNA-binding response OmpR family regulator